MDKESEKYWLGLFASWLVVFGFYFLANQCGLGFTYDSDFYLEIAKQIEVSGFSSEGFYTKPPLYPFLVYLVGVGGIWWANLLFLLISISIFYNLASEIQVKPLRISFRALMVVSFPLVWVHSFAWTEPLFICLLLVGFYLLHKYEESQQVFLLVLSLVIFLILPFVRYAGIFVLFPIAIYLLFSLPKKQKLVLVGLGILGIVLVSIWVFMFKEGFLERWENSFSSLSAWNFHYVKTNVRSYSEAFSLWVLPLNLPLQIRIPMAIMAMGTVCWQVVQLWRRKHKSILTISMFVFALYYVQMHFTFSVKFFEAERYLTPLYGLFFLSIFLWLDELWVKSNKAVKVVILGFCLFLITYNLARTVKNVILWEGIRCEMVMKKL